MKKWTSELLNVCWEDGEIVAIMYQNGETKIFKVKKANKADMAELLEIDLVKEK